MSEPLTSNPQCSAEDYRDAMRYLRQENDRLRGALRAIAVLTEHHDEIAGSVEAIASDALAGEDRPKDRPRMPPMDSRMRAEVNRGTDETSVAPTDADRWRALPALLEKYQIDYIGLLRDVDSYIEVRAALNGKGSLP